MKTGKMKQIIFAQIGTPNDDSAHAIRQFLRQFLSSRRVVDLPAWKWMPILHAIILPLRPKKLLPRYQRMTKELGGNPTLTTTKQLMHFFNLYNRDNISFHHCYALDESSIAKLEEELRIDSERIIIPLFPQYSEATCELIFDRLRLRLNALCEPRVLAIDSFYQRSSEIILDNIAKTDATALILSFHSYPLNRLEKGDTYGVECQDCFEELKKRINSVSRIQVEMSYQSKFGPGLWLGPLIEEKILELRELGHQSIAVHCPSFLIDSIETSWEIGMDLKEKVKKIGVDLHFIACIGADTQWLFSLYQAINSANAGEKSLPRA